MKKGYKMAILEKPSAIWQTRWQSRWTTYILAFSGASTCAPIGDLAAACAPESLSLSTGLCRDWSAITTLA